MNPLMEGAAVLQNLFVPTDVGDALARLSNEPAATLIAGGTLVMPVINNEVTSIRTLVSIRRLPLAGVTLDGDRVRFGAATTLADVGREPRLAILAPVVESIASPPVRNLATVGGNLFAPQPYGDLAVALLALAATVQVVGPDGDRETPVSEVLDHGLAPNEIVTAVEFAIPAARSWFYTKAMRRRLNSAAIVTVAAVIVVTENIVTEARIALGGVGPRPRRARTVESALLGQPLEITSVRAAAERAIDDAEPFSDAYASAWYRARVLPVHVRRAILGG